MPTLGTHFLSPSYTTNTNSFFFAASVPGIHSLDLDYTRYRLNSCLHCSFAHLCAISLVRIIEKSYPHYR